LTPLDNLRRFAVAHSLVARYRAGDLERRYAALGIEEDVFVSYGFVTKAVQALMHPRAGTWHWSASIHRCPLGLRT